jgi:ABC-type spermidine/putrescine transport system permease subunit II
MNRALYIILIPGVLVAIGYVLVFRYLGLPLGYPRLILAFGVFLGALWWVGRRAARKTSSPSSARN